MRLPAAVHALGTVEERIYYQVMSEQEQVPIDRQGQVLTAVSYGQLAPEERGDRRYFRRTVEATGEVALTPVNESEFDALAEDEREDRYFRILFDEGGQFAFDAGGDSLDAATYNGLGSARRGRIVGAGPLLRMRLLRRCSSTERRWTWQCATRPGAAPKMRLGREWPPAMRQRRSRRRRCRCRCL